MDHESSAAEYVFLYHSCMNVQRASGNLVVQAMMIF